MQFHTALDVNASAAAAWLVLGDRFGDLSWTATIDNSRLDGATTPDVGVCRVCTSSTSFGPFPPSVVRETLTAFDRENMTFTYVAKEGLPAFVRRAQNTWTVRAVDDLTCRIESHAVVDLAWWARPLGWLMPMAMRRDMQSFTEELRAAVEAAPTSCSVVPQYRAA